MHAGLVVDLFILVMKRGPPEMAMRRENHDTPTHTIHTIRPVFFPPQGLFIFFFPTEYTAIFQRRQSLGNFGYTVFDATTALEDNKRSEMSEVDGEPAVAPRTRIPSLVFARLISATFSVERGYTSLERTDGLNGAENRVALYLFMTTP